MRIELKELQHNLKDRNWDVCGLYKIDENEANKIIRGLELEENEQTTQNVTEDAECDSFKCRECGFEMEDWMAFDRDEDYSKEKNYHSYELKYCPDCGRKIIK